MDMDFFETEEALMVFTSALLLLLLTRKSAFDALIAMGVDEDAPEEVLTLTSIDIPPCLDNDIATSAALHNFRLCNIFSLLDEDLGFWVKPRSTAWFSRFLLEHYDDERWIKMFRMNKAAVFALADLLRPQVEKKNTRYRFAVPVLIRVACTLFKLTHGASLIICSEFFAVGKSIVSLMLREVVHAINDTLREEIKWPSGSTNDDRMLRRSTLYHPATHGNVFDPRYSVSGFSPYLLGDDVILCCALSHNVLLKQSHDEVQILLEVLRSEGLDGEFVRNAEVERDLTDVTEDELVPQGSEKREALGVYLALNRAVPCTWRETSSHHMYTNALPFCCLWVHEITTVDAIELLEEHLPLCRDEWRQHWGRGISNLMENDVTTWSQKEAAEKKMSDTKAYPRRESSVFGSALQSDNMQEVKVENSKLDIQAAHATERSCHERPEGVSMWPKDLSPKHKAFKGTRKERHKQTQLEKETLL